MLPMANTAPRTDKQVFCYVSLMKLLTNRGTTHSSTSQTEHLLSARQGLCHRHRAGEQQGQAQAAVQDREDRAMPMTGSCSAGSYWRQVFLAWKHGKSCRKGKRKVSVCLTLRERGPIYKLLQKFIWHIESAKDSCSIQYSYKLPQPSVGKSWEQQEPWLPLTNSSKPVQEAQGQCRDHCFLLCCHPIGCAGGTPESLFALCSTSLTTLCKPLSRPLPLDTHTLLCSQFIKRPGIFQVEITLFVGSPSHLLTTPGHKDWKLCEKPDFPLLASACCMALSCRLMTQCWQSPLRCKQLPKR